ncbi:hypothetical protein AERO9AM_50042 [Aeromicrobium sp. 9AM]|nr:hypothetical protein AERO9AM_50042 [Aeromicrobium sp. 9AM]
MNGNVLVVVRRDRVLERLSNLRLLVVGERLRESLDLINVEQLRTHLHNDVESAIALLWADSVDIDEFPREQNPNNRLKQFASDPIPRDLIHRQLLSLENVTLAVAPPY